MIIAALLLFLANANCSPFLTNDQESSIAITYARDRLSDRATNECLNEMYPRNLYHYPLEIDKNDIPCIVHCVLRKFGIMTNDGAFNVQRYYQRVQAIHKYDSRILVSDVGETCAQNIRSMNLDHDVCKKAMLFNDCTQLYAVVLNNSKDE